MVKSIRIAHIADLHFSEVTFHPKQFLSKRWIGNTNLLFLRRRKFNPLGLSGLIDTFRALEVEYVLIAGDISSTARTVEFEQGKRFIEALEKEGLKVITLPGNHDQYTQKNYDQGTFFRHFSNDLETDDFSLAKDHVALIPLQNNWQLLMLDTAVATSLLSSQGEFTEKAEENLLKALFTIPDSTNVILVNHFPLFKTEKKRRTLLGCDRLQKIVQDHPKIKIYLHGHSHRHVIADLRSNHFPIIIDSGSIGYRTHSTWNLLELLPDQCTVKAFRAKQPLSQEKNHWDLFKTMEFAL